jgi:pilus assembly protein CpaE
VTEAQRRIVEDGVDLAIFDPSYATDAGVSDGGQLLQVDPELPLVLVADTLDMSVLRTALRIGFADVVDAPVDRAKVDGMLELINDQAQRAVLKEAKARIGKIITIMSPKGGAGKTMTTANVALQLAMWGDPSRVVIVDADLQFGDVCIAMQIDPIHTIVDAAQEFDKLDDELLESLLSTHSSGLRVLAAPLEPSLADKVSTQVVVRVLGMLKRMFDYVIIDTAPFLDEPVLSILERSDDVLLVVEMDLPNVKNAKLALDTLKLLKFPLGKIKLVLNRMNSKARLDIGELERSLELEVQAAISSDKLVPRAVNEGEPVVSLYPRSRVAKDLRGVARLVVDYESTPEIAEGEGQRKWFG